MAAVLPKLKQTGPKWKKKKKNKCYEDPHYAIFFTHKLLRSKYHV
jgi:hypothetical protein